MIVRTQEEKMPRFCDDYDYEDENGRSEFADPGGKSALRASSKTNPRNLPCPTCKRPNLLTPKDRALGYQCDSCADAAEGGYGCTGYGEY
jgi:hypothetical protein